MLGPREAGSGQEKLLRAVWTLQGAQNFVCLVKIQSPRHTARTLRKDPETPPGSREPRDFACTHTCALACTQASISQGPSETAAHMGYRSWEGSRGAVTGDHGLREGIPASATTVTVIIGSHKSGRGQGSKYPNPPPSLLPLPLQAHPGPPVG